MVVCSRRIVAASSKHHQAQDCLSERIVGEQLQRGLVFTRIDAEMKNTVLPISLQFYYNSSYKDRNYGYGLGFSMGEEMRYALSLSGDSVTIERGDGRSDLYLKKIRAMRLQQGCSTG